MRSSDLPAVSLVYPRTQSLGGAQGVLAWSVHALQDCANLLVYTLDPSEPERWNRMYGTRIDPARIQWINLKNNHPWFSGILERLNMITLDQYVLAAWFNQTAPPESFPFCCHNEISFRRPGLQYIHFPMLMTGDPQLARRVGQSGSLPKECFGIICKGLFRTRQADLRRNLSLCNSLFIEDLYQQHYGPSAPTRCVYPPVRLPNVKPLPLWETRANRVVMIGRLVRHKRFEEGIELIKQSRDHGSELTLHIASTGGEEDYRQELETLSRSMPWIHWHWNLPRTELQQLCMDSKFGLHCNRNEHFGMVTAELSGLGCIVLGHDSGGTREILPHPDQRFQTPKEGAQKLLQLLDSPSTRQEVLEQSQHQSLQFGEERFCREIREIVLRLAETT